MNCGIDSVDTDVKIHIATQHDTRNTEFLTMSLLHGKRKLYSHRIGYRLLSLNLWFNGMEFEGFVEAILKARKCQDAIGVECVATGRIITIR